MKGAFGILLLAAIAPLLCRGRVEQCRGVDGFNFPPEDQTSFVSYSYTQSAGLDDCLSVTQQCYATIPNQNLRQRTWYIDDTKAPSGFGYKPTWVQIYNVQCPPDTVLHIIPLVLDTEGSSILGNCPTNDFVTVDVPGMESIDLCGSRTDLENNPAYQSGFGLVVEGGNASIAFCTNDNEVANDGFAVRASCVDLRAAYIERCVDFNDVISTPEGRQFVDRIMEPFDDVAKANILHKRSIEEIVPSVKHWGVSPDNVPKKVARVLRALQRNRQKRFDAQDDFLSFDLAEGQLVTYTFLNQLTIDFNNGTTLTFTVPWLIAVNDQIGTRIFDREAPPELLLTGPGKVELFNGLALVDFTIQPENLPGVVLPNNLEEASNLNLISRYLYENFIRPYPFTCPADTTESPPLPPASNRDPRWRYIEDLNFIRPDIQNGTCYRSTVPALAASPLSFLDRGIFDYCQFFYYSCNPLVQAVCTEATRINPAG